MFEKTYQSKNLKIGNWKKVNTKLKYNLLNRNRNYI